MRQRKRLLHEARNFALYYGRGAEAQLSLYDMVIVEPMGQTIENISMMQAQGTLVFGYISILEAGPHMPEYNQINSSDFLRVKGKHIENKTFGTRLLDLRSPKWKKMLFQKINKLIGTGSYDGLFMDTIGDVERTDLPDVTRQMLILESLSLILEIKRLFPNKLLIQNNGLEELCFRTAPFIDAICWENPILMDVQSSYWSSEMVKKLSLLQAQFDLRILLLYEKNNDLEDANLTEASKLAKKHRFLLYRAQQNYLGRINDPV
jgi:polysaccharide biosynthesis protein PelA